MPSIHSFTMTCEEVNDYGTFSEGDRVRGNVTLVLLKETTIDSFFVKCKGDAAVRWSTKSGDRTRTHSAHRRYFKLKHSIINESSPDKLVSKGTHVYDFCFTLPTGSLPSSYKGTHGKIIYMVEVKLSRDWKMTRKLERELKFVSKAVPNPHSLMVHQVGSTDKEMGLFSKGRVHMEVNVDRHGCAPGETVKVFAKINNASSRDMAPKFSLVQDVYYYAEGTSKHESKVIFKQIDELIKPNTKRTAKCAIQIPRDVAPTINNCQILTLEYDLKVYLDISFATDPEVLFRLTICHPELISNLHPDVPGGPNPTTNVAQHPAGAFGGSPIHNRQAPTAAMGSQPYRYYGSHNYPPPQYAAQPSYQRYEAPQQPYHRDPYTAPSSTLHPPPCALRYHPSPSAPEVPTLPPNTPSAPPYNFQPSAPPMNTDFLSEPNEAPPAYSALFPDPDSDTSAML